MSAPGNLIGKEDARRLLSLLREVQREVDELKTALERANGGE